MNGRSKNTDDVLNYIYWTNVRELSNIKYRRKEKVSVIQPTF